MPLETREDYIRLNDHLSEIDGRLAQFARMHGFTYEPPLIGGLYPRVSLTKYETVTRSIQISMDFTERDERYDQFFPEIPYTIFAAAWIDDQTELVRWRGPSLRIERLAFFQLAARLDEHLCFFHTFVQGVSEDYIRAINLTSFIGERLNEHPNSPWTPP